MIKRIKEISNLGRFRRMLAAPLEFARLTFICGENALGKSTLADILSCLETRDSSVMEERRTLPKDARKPCVVIGVAVADESETTVDYRDGVWRAPGTFDLRLAVFDDGFQSRNVFTGRVFERANREQLTSFVLGYKGVALAEEIAAKKAEQTRAKKRVTALAKDALQNVGSIPDFLALAPESTVGALEADLRSLDGRLADLRNRFKGAAQFADRPLPVLCDAPPIIVPLTTRAASILQEALPDVLRAARESLSTHIARSFRNPAGAEPWIQEGLRQNRGEICQLCGQGLSHDALGLFQAYENYFSAEYADRENEVRTELPRIVASIEEAAKARCFPRVEQNDLILAQYSDCDAASEFREAVARVRETGQALAKAEDRCQRSLNDFHGALKTSVREKSQSPMTTVSCPQGGELEESELALRDAVLTYNGAISTASDVIRALKAASTPGRIEEEGKRLAAEKEAKTRLLRRLELAPQVEEYQREAKLAGALDSEIEGMRRRLEEEQNAFLSSYFERLNQYFRLFGSREFALSRRVDYRGHLPVVSIEVLFRGSPVPDARVEHLFSASDRRALSLAVFWAQIYGRSETERARTILVLDDPVTSFDEHRIGAHNDALLKASRDFRQVIVLTHFGDQVARFLRAYAGESTTILALQRDGDGTKVVAGDREALIATEHEKARKSLFDFADGRSSAVDAGSMRVFFETELEHRFSHQLHRHSITGGDLSERLNRMEAVGILQPSVARAAHDWRLRLNAEHHCFQGATIEDQRGTANELREFIYLHLTPAAGG